MSDQDCNWRKRFYAAYATLQTRQQMGDMTPYEASVPVFQWRLGRLLSVDRNARCLDLACGSGLFLYFLKQCGFSGIEGVDISPEQVALARQVCLNVYERDVNEFLSECGSDYDLVTVFSFIEHLKRDEALTFVNRVSRIVRPGGRVLLVTPNANSPFAAHMRYGDLTHEIIYTPESLASLLRCCGFINCRAFETGPVPHGVTSAIRWGLWKCLSTCLMIYRLIEGGTCCATIFTTEFIMIAERGDAESCS